VTDANGNKTSYTYDKLGRRITTLDRRGGVTRTTYDAVGNVLSLTDPVGNTTTYTYDGLSRKLTEMNAQGQVRQYEYDAAGNLVLVTDRNGRQIRYDYDELNRRVAERWYVVGTLDPVQTITMAYYPGGRLQRLCDGFTTLQYEYCDTGALKRESIFVAGWPRIDLSYTTNDTLNVTSLDASIELPGGGMTTLLSNRYVYTTDTFRLDRITQSGSDTASKSVLFSYLPDAYQVTGIARYAGIEGTPPLVARSSFAYNAVNRIGSVTHKNASDDTVASYVFGYDPLQRVNSINSYRDGQAVLTYDAEGQLTGVDYSNSVLPDETYRYDLAGNRLESHRHGTGYETPDHSDNQLATNGATEFEYDAEGNVVLARNSASGAVREFTWDHRNRLVEVVDKNGAGTVVRQIKYTYDAVDRRIAVSVDENPADGVPGSVRWFVYDGGQVLLEFVDADGPDRPAAPVLDVRYLNGIGTDQVLAEDVTGAGVFWFLADHQGSVRDVIDSSGQLADHVLMDSFGNILGRSNAALYNRYAFTGREYDAETGLYYYRARYYDPDNGRFISADSAGLAAGDANLYRYVGNDPVNQNDPSGHLWIDASPMPQFQKRFITKWGLDATMVTPLNDEFLQMEKYVEAKRTQLVDFLAFHPLSPFQLYGRARDPNRWWANTKAFWKGAGVGLVHLVTDVFKELYDLGGFGLHVLGLNKEYKPISDFGSTLAAKWDADRKAATQMWANVQKKNSWMTNWMTDAAAWGTAVLFTEYGMRKDMAMAPFQAVAAFVDQNVQVWEAM
ncbi:MAG: RHS repeat-associated core domain-containing protein, partial [Verrucomicrobiia bacterium]